MVLFNFNVVIHAPRDADKRADEQTEQNEERKRKILDTREAAKNPPAHIEETETQVDEAVPTEVSTAVIEPAAVEPLEVEEDTLQSFAVKMSKGYVVSDEDGRGGGYLPVDVATRYCCCTSFVRYMFEY